MTIKRYLVAIGTIALFPALSHSQGDKFQHPASFPDINTVYQYSKSNWDGTHASTIYLYVRDSNTIESFKWSKGDKEATLVTAVMDWRSFSIKKFSNHKLRYEKEPQQKATLENRGGNTLTIIIGGATDSMQLAALPWHSYDFDFAGLGFSWRALKSKKNSFHFHIADVELLEGKPVFANKGQVQVDYTGTDTINGRQCLKYRIDGEGLKNKGGYIWINPLTFMIEQYKISLPDEPGFTNGMLKLVKTEMMTAAQWDSFMKERLAE